MTLAIGTSESRRRRAFTLIELVLVLALLVVAVSMVAPHMSGFIRGQALDSEARRLAAVAHAARALAVSRGMPVVLWVDAKQGRYGFQLETPVSNGGSQAQDFTADENVQLSVMNSGAGTAVVFNSLPAIRFLADGSVDEGSPVTVQLKDSGGRSLWMVESSNRNGYEISDTN